MISMACDSAHEELDGGHDGGHVEPCGGALDGSFEVFCEAAVAAEPGEGSLDDPAARQHLEAFCGVGALDDLKRPGADFSEGGGELLAGIGAVGEDMVQPGKAVSDRGEYIGFAVAVLDIGGMDDGADQKAFGVGEDMALPARDLLARVKAPDSAAFRGLHRLAVDDAGAWGSLPPDLLARRHQQRVVDRGPQPHIAPAVEVMLHRRHRREHLGRQHPPGQAAAQQVQQRLDDLPIAPDRRPASLRVRRQKRLQKRPFRIRQIAWQAQPLSRKLLAGDVSPHLVTPWLLRHTHGIADDAKRQSQVTGITQFLFRSGSEDVYSEAYRNAVVKPEEPIT